MGVEGRVGIASGVHGWATNGQSWLLNPIDRQWRHRDTYLHLRFSTAVFSAFVGYAFA